MEETIKICKTCLVEKSVNDFAEYSIARMKGKKKPHCRSCEAKKQRDYYKNNPQAYEKQKELERNRWQRKRDEELITLTEKLGKEKFCTKCGFTGPIDKFYNSNRQIKNAVNKVRLRGTCLTCYREKEKQWRDANPDKMKIAYKKTYARRKNDEQHKLQRSEYQKNRYLNDESYREQRKERDRMFKNSPKGIWRRLLSNALTQLKTTRPKQTRTLTLLGYSHETLFNIVGSKPEGNYHLDHSIPLSWMVNETPVSIACDFNNLTWITEYDNLAKNNRYSNPVNVEYFNKVKQYIKPQYHSRFIVVENKIHDNQKQIIMDRWSKGLSSVI
jgi:hypothetical protein